MDTTAPYQKGFTLLELMIVLMIIGILSAIIIPNFSKISLKSKDVAMAQLGNTLQVGLESYFLDHASFPSEASLSGPALISILVDAHYLPQAPTNPYTGCPFNDDASDGKILYTYDADTGGYELSLYGQGQQFLKKISH